MAEPALPTVPDVIIVEADTAVDHPRQLATLGRTLGPLVAVDDPAVSFLEGGREVSRRMRGVDLTIGRGEILGRSSASPVPGKSVLGLSLLGVVACPTPRPRCRGSVQVCGVDVLGVPDDAARRGLRRRHLGAVFQDPMTSLNPTMRVGRQIAEVAGTEDEAVRLLDAVGVPEPRRRLRAYPTRSAVRRPAPAGDDAAMAVVRASRRSSSPPTSPRPRFDVTVRRRRSSSLLAAPAQTRPAAASCSSPTTWASPPRSPTASPCFTAVGWPR